VRSSDSINNVTKCPVQATYDQCPHQSRSHSKKVITPKLILALHQHTWPPPCMCYSLLTAETALQGRRGHNTSQHNSQRLGEVHPWSFILSGGACDSLQGQQQPPVV